jgi:hypothetical protein
MNITSYEFPSRPGDTIVVEFRTFDYPAQIDKMMTVKLREEPKRALASWLRTMKIRTTSEWMVRRAEVHQDAIGLGSYLNAVRSTAPGASEYVVVVEATYTWAKQLSLL